MPLGILNNLNPVNRDHILATGLVSWYLALPHFASGKLWQDLGLAQNTGTFNGNAVWNTSQRPGGFSAGTNYDGSNSFVDATSIQLPTGAGVPITIAFWCRSNNLTGFRTPYFYGNNAAGFGIIFAQDGTSNDGTIDVGVVGSNFISSTKKLAVNQWTHLCLTYDGTTAQLYFNGLLDSSAAVTLHPLEVFNRIGSYIGSQFWSGDIDDVRIYWYGLTGTLVKELFDNSTQGCPGLLNFVQPQLLSVPPPPSFSTLPVFMNGPPMPGTPWFQKIPPTPPAPPSATAMTALAQLPTLPGFEAGPPIPGSPWFRNTPPELPSPPSPTAPGTTIVPVLPPFTVGPPIRTAPWFRNVPTELDATPFASAANLAALANVPTLTPFTVGPPIKGAPWFKDVPAIPLDVRLPAPGIVNRTPPPPFTAGPPMLGVPWIMAAGARGIPGQQPPQTPPPAAPPTGKPDTTHYTAAAPPMPGAPWFVIPQAPQQFTGGAPPVPIPQHGPGADVTLLQRDPTQEQPLRRFTEILATIINSLVGQGILVQIKPSSWTIKASTTGLSGNVP